ncbi:MAG: hypothetical protein ACLGIR_01990 [Actinomycetes bacterium]
MNDTIDGADAPDTTGADEPVTEPDATTEALPALRGRVALRRAAPWLVTVLALALAGWSTWQWQVLAAREDAVLTVRATATDVLTVLTNWDADELDTTRTSLEAAGTDAFAEQVDEFVGPQAAEALAAAGTRSEGAVEDLFVQSIDGDRAVVFAIVAQALVSDDTEGVVQPATRAAELRLQLVDGRWLVDGIDLIEPTIAEVAG